MQLWINGIGLAFVFLGLLFSGMAAKAAVEATNAAVASVRVAEDTARRELRAYLGSSYSGRTPSDLPAFGTGGPNGAGRLGGYHTLAKNIGQTPAFKVTIIQKAVILRVGEEGSYSWELPQTRPMDFCLHPGQTTSRQVIVDDPDGGVEQMVSVANQDAVRNNTSKIWVYGRIDYEDIYGRPHWTRFKYKIGKIQLREGEMGVADNGNDADQDPPHQSTRT